ncbi:MAG TPA: glycoside-pentoside-hexuronide (GPH):cation symporter [Bacilli bacterium]|nr:glycoside-pentoside-hexuronide (GPH):cation symporter [Bacilli bacterium]
MKISTTFEGDRVPRATKWTYPMTGIGRDMLYTLVSLFLMIFIQYTLDKTSPGGYGPRYLAITIIIIIYRVWDGLNDPMLGRIIENTHWKMGKYKPWILIGAVGSAITLAMMFSLLPLVDPFGWWYVVLFAVLYLLWEIFFTMNDIAYWSMLPALSSNEKERAQLTTLVSIGASIGAFIVGGIVPRLISGRAIVAFRYIGIVVAATFLLSQILLIFVCKEHARPAVEETAEKVTTKQMFLVIWRNKELWTMMIVITLYYLGGALLNGLGLNYFWFAFDYSTGGLNMGTVIVAMAIGTLIGNIIFPFVNKFLNWAKMLNMSFIVMVVANLALFATGFIPALLSTTPSVLLMCAFVAISSLVGSLFYMTLLIMVTNTIEYNQWKTGARNESIIYAARPFAAKISSSIQQLVIYGVLAIGGIFAITQDIASLEVNMNKLIETTHTEAQVEDIVNQMNSAIVGAPNIMGARIALIAGMTLIPIILYTIAYIYTKKSYHIDEKVYAKMVADIKEGKVGPDNKISNIIK